MECVNFQYTLLKATVCIANSLHFAHRGISSIVKDVVQILGTGEAKYRPWRKPVYMSIHELRGVDPHRYIQCSKIVSKAISLLLVCQECTAVAS